MWLNPSAESDMLFAKGIDMVQTILTTEKLRQHLQEHIETMNAEQLLQMYQLMAQLYGQELSEKITQDWQLGRVTREQVEAAIHEHRAKYPYAPPPISEAQESP